MTPTEKQKCIAEQMLYGLLFLHEETETLAEYAFGRKLLYWRDIIDSKEKLILRPLSDITKEITHKGYNDDKPFIPLVELAKMSEKDFTLKSLHNDNTESAAEYIIMTDWGNGVQECIIRFAYSYDLNRFYKFQVTPFRKPFGVAYQQNMFDLLHQLHFDDRSLIELGEAISTDIINPYSK